MESDPWQTFLDLFAQGMGIMLPFLIVGLAVLGAMAAISYFMEKKNGK